MSRLLLLILIPIVGIYLHRLISYTEIDDLHPLLPCKNHLKDKSRYLWIIPCYKEVPIIKYPEWCRNLADQAKKEGKILGMHGIEHPEPHDQFYRDGEFCYDIPSSRIKYGMEIFKKAFGYYPKFFKAPHCLSTANNIHKIESLGMEYKGIINQILHKVYHCHEASQPWYLHEWLVNLF